jgi:folate-binding protein YgfZ
MNAISIEDVSTWQGALTLPDLGLIRAEGPDAATFLHGQLSQDVTQLGSAEGRLAAYCSVKGRMQATALILRPANDLVLLVTDSGVLPGWLKRLKMFVLRAKVQLLEAGEGSQTWGLAGQSARAALGAAADAPVWSRQDHAGGQLVRLPDVLQSPRWLWIGAPVSADWLRAMPSVSASAWSCMEVLSGIPRVTPATVDQFVPQMVNYELVGGVNFQKGCYPGQEIVARSQYRGTVKRRAFIAEVHAGSHPGQEVFSLGDASQPAGMVILAAPVPGTASDPTEAASLVLVELKLAAASGVITLGSPEGPVLHLHPMPYEVPQSELQA